MMEQGSEEWFAVRCGKATASKIQDIIAKGRGTAPPASRKNYEAQLIAERLTGTPAESFSSSAMQWGTETEPQARDAYAFDKNVDIVEAGFIQHPSISMSGASPDGLVGDDGLIEIKCPNTATHLETLLGAAIPAKYYTQMQWQMACIGRAWCDFVSFDPRMPDNLQLKIQRVERDDAFISTTEKAVSEFLEGVSAKVERLQEL